MQPRAIETRYKGYRFRSRLEARWAVFFDALGLKWEYEPEGFELGGGVRYLPDFYLPDWRLWVEIKGGDVLAADYRKAELLACIGRHPVIVFKGMPGDAAGEMFYTTLSNQQEQNSWVCPAIPCFGLFPDKGGRIYVPIDHDDEDDLYKGKGAKFWFKGVCMDQQDIAELWGCAGVDRAVDAARGARFEHGENGGRR